MAKHVRNGRITANAKNICQALDGSVFDYLISNPKLRDIAEVHRGIEWEISLKENRSILISSEPRTGFKKGLKKVSKKMEPYWAQGFIYLNMNERYHRTPAHSLPWGKPKVLANRHIISSGPWQIVGFPDSGGLVCYQNFIGIWPKININIEVLSALVNSPLANAALFVKQDKCDIGIKTVEHIPTPFLKSIPIETITQLVRYYMNLRSVIKKDTTEKAAIQECIQTLMKIDGLILKAYDLPPRLERKLLDLFRGHPRPVPFDFPEYFPEDFHPCIPLHKYIVMDLEQASAVELLKRITPFDTADMHEFFMDIEARQS
jgi:hypothetical protein